MEPVRSSQVLESIENETEESEDMVHELVGNGGSRKKGKGSNVLSI